MASPPRYLVMSPRERADSSSRRMLDATQGHAYTVAAASSAEVPVPADHSRRGHRRLSRRAHCRSLSRVRRRRAQSTKDWVSSQNALAQPYLEALPQRAWLGNRLKQLWTYERFGVPQREAGKYFFLRNDGTQDQSVLYVADGLNATPRVMVDPNGKRDDATIALSQWSPSPDGKLLAYALSDGGTDWNIWHFRRVEDGTDLPVVLKFSKFWPMSWAHDSSGVYYSRYPVKAGENAETAERGDDAGRPDVYFHKLGEPQASDRLVYQVTDHPSRVPAAVVTEDGRYLHDRSFRWLQSNGVLVQDLRKAGASRSRCSPPGMRCTTSSARRVMSCTSRPPMARRAAA